MCLWIFVDIYFHEHFLIKNMLDIFAYVRIWVNTNVKYKIHLK